MSGQTAEPDLEVIVPQPGVTKFAGVTCKVRRIRTRELMALINVLFVGAGEQLSTLASLPEDDEDRKNEVVALLLMSLPNAIDEFLVFLEKILEVDDTEDRKKVVQALRNPDPSDLIDVAVVVVEQEWDDLDALMGKAERLTMAVGQLRKRSDGGSRDRSLARST